MHRIHLPTKVSFPFLSSQNGKEKLLGQDCRSEEKPQFPFSNMAYDITPSFFHDTFMGGLELLNFFRFQLFESHLQTGLNITIGNERFS